MRINDAACAAGHQHQLVIVGDGSLFFNLYLFAFHIIFYLQLIIASSACLLFN